MIIMVLYHGDCRPLLAEATDSLWVGLLAAMNILRLMEIRLKFSGVVSNSLKLVLIWLNDQTFNIDENRIMASGSEPCNSLMN